MGHVVVRIPGPLRPFADGAESVHVPGGTLADVVRSIGELHPQLTARLLTPEGGLRPYVNVFVGRDNVRDLQGLGTVVPDGAEVFILPAVAGG
jgi:molybdopterin converting factor small subunit